LDGESCAVAGQTETSKKTNPRSVFIRLFLQGTRIL
jgi:hypothetical protein